MSVTNSNFPRLNSSKCPLLWLAICFSLGIFLASNLDFDWKIFLGGCLLAGAVSVVLVERSFGVVFVLLAFFFGGAFLFQINEQAKPANRLKTLYDTNQINSGDPIEIEGVLEGKPELAVGGVFFILKSDKAIYKNTGRKTAGRVRVFASIRDDEIKNEYDDLALGYGTRIRIACNLRREERFQNPGSVSFKKILDQKNLDAVATIKSPLLIERLESGSQSLLFGSIFDYRQNLIESFRDNFSIATSGILIASLLGNRHFLTKDNAEVFRDGGTFHVLVISGLHITFIGGLILLLMRRFTRRRLWQFIATSLVLWMYSFAVGAEIPVIRAALMFTILLFSFVIYRKRNLFNALGGCGLLILVWRPEDFFSQSFHLTFASLVGIVGVAFPLIERLRSIGGWQPSTENPFPPNVSKQLRKFCEVIYWSERKWDKTLSENLWDCRLFKTSYAAKLENSGFQKPLRWLFEGTIVTAIVQIFLLPFLVLYFHRIAFSSVLLNLWVGVLIVLQNVAAVLAMFFAQFSDALALPVVKLTEVFNWLLLAIPKMFIAGDLASDRIPLYSGGFRAIYLIYLVPVILIIGFVNGWNPFRLGSPKDGASRFSPKRFFQFTICIFVVLFCVIVFHPFSSPHIDGRLRVDFLDVGQGDSILIIFPNGKTMLVDGGGKHNFQKNVIERKDGEVEPFEPDIQGIGESVVSEFLWEKGYSKVDFVLATHSDADHIQGLSDILRNFDVKAVLVGRESPGNEDFERLKNEAIGNDLKLTKLARGDTFEVEGVKLEVLNPTSEDIVRDSSNNDSIVIRLTYGSKRFLLTGDIESETERALARNPQALKADVVKVAHHGSRTSSIQSFIDSTEAEYAVIPVGRKSRFGHPHEEVVKRWKGSGAKVFTTGEKGTVSISTDGKDIQVQTYLK